MRCAGLIALAIAVVFLAAFAFLVAGGHWYVVGESEQAVITQFGKPVGEPVATPGLHRKLPFIQEATFIDMRVLEWDSDPIQLPTGDKHFLVLDAWAQWRIVDPLVFFQRLRDERGALARLDDIIDGETRNTVTKIDLAELVRSTNRELYLPSPIDDDVPEITTGRAELERQILDRASERVRELGIEILDLRYKRIDYVSDERSRVYERMIAKRRRIAELIRQEGAAEAARIERARR
jgi:membrane protease subunit HflC